MKVCVIGTGYVGLVTGTCLAEMGNDVVCVDNNEEKIAQLLKGQVPIYEPGLEELIQTNTREGRLQFTTNLTQSVKEAMICMIAVGTPQGEDGSADLTYVLQAGEMVAKAMNGYKVIVVKSTVPVGTSEKVQQVVAQNTQHPFSVVSNPEFLKQGAAVEDCLKPDRVIIGVDNKRPTDKQASDIMRELYAPFMRTGNRVQEMDINAAEMTKYAANCFLATKISFINEMSNLCERLGVDVEQVRAGIATDSRIGSQFLFPGLGYGGSCFPKDVKALIKTAQETGRPSAFLECVDEVNKQQRSVFLEKIKAEFQGNLSGKTFAVWGLAFKPRTDDMREAPSITIIEALLEAGARVQAFDPKAMETAKWVLGENANIAYTQNAYDTLANADALLLLTEWNEFRRPDFDKMMQLMKQPIVFDGRNQYDPERMIQRGFTYHSIGRNHLSQDVKQLTPA